MSAPLSARFRSLFALDKDAFWWNEYNDYERSLSRMNLSELAGELDRTKVRNETANTIIVEHLLAMRLARIQSRASIGAAWLGIVGALAVAVLSFYLGKLSADSPPKAECVPSLAAKDVRLDRPIQVQKTGNPERGKLSASASTGK